MGSRQKSTVGSEAHPPEHQFLKMEAIKKKMQAMKVEKDNACDQADVSEEKMKEARIRAQKGEDEVEELLIKSRQLETELDMTAERLGIATLQLEEKLLTPPTMRSPRSSPPVRPTLRRLRNAQMSVRPRSLSWRRRRPIRGRRPTRNRSRP